MFFNLIINSIYFQISNRNSHTKKVNTLNFFFNRIINSFDFFFQVTNRNTFLTGKNIFFPNVSHPNDSHDMTRMERYDQTKLDGLLLELNNRDTTPNDSWIWDYPNISICIIIYSNMNVIDQTCNIYNIKKTIIQNNGILFMYIRWKQNNNMCSI